MLMERRVAFIGSDLEKFVLPIKFELQCRVSQCIHAAACALLPFRWQHIFIPVRKNICFFLITVKIVPAKLLTYLEVLTNYVNSLTF